MDIDVLGKDPKKRWSTTEVARRIGTHTSTVWRWVHDGVLVDGDRVRLEAIRIGGRKYIEPEALTAFLAKLNERSEHPDRAVPDVIRRCEEAGL